MGAYAPIANSWPSSPRRVGKHCTAGAELALEFHTCIGKEELVYVMMNAEPFPGDFQRCADHKGLLICSGSCPEIAVLPYRLLVVESDLAWFLEGEAGASGFGYSCPCCRAPI